MLADQRLGVIERMREHIDVVGVADVPQHAERTAPPQP